MVWIGSNPQKKLDTTMFLVLLLVLSYLLKGRRCSHSYVGQNYFFVIFFLCCILIYCLFSLEITIFFEVNFEKTINFQPKWRSDSFKTRQNLSNSFVQRVCLPWECMIVPHCLLAARWMKNREWWKLERMDIADYKGHRTHVADFALR